MNTTFLKELRTGHVLIECANMEEKRSILSVLELIGEKVYEDSKKIESLLVGFDTLSMKMFMGFSSKKDKKVYPFHKAISLLASEPAREVVLNEQYTAQYTKGDTFVTVGCQKIPVAKVDELYSVIHA